MHKPGIRKCAELSSKAHRGFQKTPSRAQAASESQMVASPTLWQRGGMGWEWGRLKQRKLAPGVREGQDTVSPVFPQVPQALAVTARSPRLLPSPPDPHPWALTQPDCGRAETAQWPSGPSVTTTWLLPELGSPSRPSLSACLCLRLCVRRCGSSSGPRALTKGCLSGWGRDVPVEVWGSHFLFSDGSQWPRGWLAPIASGNRDDSCGKASCLSGHGAEGGPLVKAKPGRQGHWLILLT